MYLKVFLLTSCSVDLTHRSPPTKYDSKSGTIQETAPSRMELSRALACYHRRFPLAACAWVLLQQRRIAVGPHSSKVTAEHNFERKIERSYKSWGRVRCMPEDAQIAHLSELSGVIQPVHIAVATTTTPAAVTLVLANW